MYIKPYVPITYVYCLIFMHVGVSANLYFHHGPILLVKRPELGTFYKLVDVV